MSSPPLKYEEINPWTRGQIDQALSDDDSEVLLVAVIAASMHDEDWKYAQDLCVRLSGHSHFNVRGNAVLGFGHIARVHGKLDQSLVHPIIKLALKDDDDFIRGQAHDAKDDTEHFLGWIYQET